MPAPVNLTREIRNNNPDKIAADLRLASKPKPFTFSDGVENKSYAIIGYAFVGLIDFLFGLLIGWLIWGN